jgi:hypothetical protein
VLNGQGTLIQSQGSYITLDFGKEVTGIATVTFSAASGAGESVGLAFSESTDFVGTNSDGSNSGINSGASGSTDGAIFATTSGTGTTTYTMPTNKVRGGFRYLTLFMNTAGWVHVSNVSVNFTAVPLMANPSAYPNYFYSNDDLINKIWYAGAYTVQTNIISPNQGRVYPLTTGWDNSATISPGTSVLVDGARRDRTVWPGDLGISAATAYVSIDDTVSVKNAIQQMYDSQKSSGELPYGGPPFNLYGSDTYHLWSMIGTYNYYLYSGDLAWVNSVWPKYQTAMTFIRNKVNGAHGLLNVTGTADWARHGQGGENIAANAMLYRVLVTGALLSNARGDTSTATTYNNAAATLKANINSALWDAGIGAYRDQPGSTTYPQDGNSEAVWFDVTDSTAKASSIANYLKSNWGTYGSRTPEWDNNVSPFIGGMELMAQGKALNDTDMLNLIRREWGYMYNSPRGPKTFWEGIGADGGSGGYAGWFMSYSHGWSSGPTPALTFFTLGINPTTAKGQQYSVIPHPGDLTHVEGQLTVDAGKLVKVNYDHASGGSFTMTVDAATNTGSTGVVGIPKFGLSRIVSINGATAWDGSAFVATSGITSADQDANYIYFRGVQPGARTFSYGAAATWTTCGNEAAQCAFTGTKGVRYGAGTSFLYGSFTNGVTCGNASFGDPAPGVAKHCEISDTELPPPVGSWTSCAAEGQQCAFSNTKTVAFGAKGLYKLAVKTGSANCDAATFGDPISGVVKGCYYSTLPQNAGLEAPAVSGFAYNPAGALWTFTAQNGNAGSGIQANGGAFGASAAPEGIQTAFLQGAGSMTQTLTDVSAGSYAVRFAAAKRAWTGGGQQSFNVYIDGNLAGTFSPASIAFSYFTTNTMVLAAGNHTVSFTGTNVTGDNTGFIDAVSLLKF